MQNAIQSSSRPSESPSSGVREYLEQAIKTIDAAFGDGYAKKNPHLVSAFLAASASEHHSSVLIQLERDRAVAASSK